VIVFNNDNKGAEIEFDISPIGFSNGYVMQDRLGVSRDVSVRDGRFRVALPKRSVAMFVPTFIGR
jgi:hypothetical protein